MKFPEYAIRIILVLMFIAAAGARFSSTSGSLYPYFRGESAMNYRDALTVAEGGTNEGLDQLTKKSNWPQGYRPARVRPVGVEYFAGVTFKVVTWLSDTDTRKIAKRLLVFFFSLCVFTVYALTRNLWQSQTAGLLAAALVAFYPSLIEVTNGREISHTPFALVLITFHLLALQRFTRGSTRSGVVWLSFVTFLLVAAWELAAYYIAVCVLVTTLFYPLRQDQRRMVALAQMIAFIAAAVVLPNAKALRLVFSWQAALLVACCAQTFLVSRFPGTRRGGLFILGISVLLTLGLTPLRSGAEAVEFPGMEYVYYRLRFLFARPVAPSLLPESIRHLWTANHSHPSAYSLILYFAPLVFLVPAAIAVARRMLRDAESTRVTARLALSASLAAFASLLFVIDRSAIAMASVATFPFLGLGGFALETRARRNGMLVVAGGLLVVLQLLWPTGRPNPTLQLAKLLGVVHRDISKVTWVSLENTDRELVRFVAIRTSTRNAILGRPDRTALLLTFSGRTSVLLAGGRSSAFARKHVEITEFMYGEEDRLYRQCREMDIDYVLFSADYLLDTTRYSPLYLAGLAAVPENCVAVSMHFSPESLVHFNLVYENDYYRLFRVTDKPEPVFATDHPPVFQRDILERHGDTYASFQDRITRLIITYTDAMRYAAIGNHAEALRGLVWCLQQAPRFSRARIAAGSMFLELGQPQKAKEVLSPVIRYAPDNAWALYYTAYALAQLGEADAAQGLISILYTVTNDTDLLDRAELLETFIKQGVPLNSTPTPTDTIP